MKAERGQVVGRGIPKRERTRPAELEVLEENPDDLIMVMMPKVTFDAVQELASRHGASVGETINYALKLLEQTMNEEQS